MFFQLQQRVERMDRRVSLNHKTKVTDVPTSSTEAANSSVVASSAPQLPILPLKQSTPPEKPFQKEEDSQQPPESPRIIGGKNSLGQQQPTTQKTASAMQERPTRSCRNMPPTATDSSPAKR